ncbi:MAG: hypothetical protein FWG83_04865 [Oscillospiraceae bacterium]|nr:hypothetical protein [Oscillospiraceae bacterium]
MEAIRTIVDSNLLNIGIPLPEYLQNKKVEVVISPFEDLKEKVVKKATLPSLTMEEINEMMCGSITESLIGIIPDCGMSTEEYREERLKKYEISD